LFNFAASQILDEVIINCSRQLKTLRIVNISREPFQMLELASFVNLKDLYISPHNLGPDMVTCFGKCQVSYFLCNYRCIKDTTDVYDVII
jgi:hypothetical protein